MRAAAFALLLAACASSKPTLAIYYIDAVSLCWFCDGSDAVFEVTNPTSKRLAIKYRCEGENGPLDQEVTVDAHDQWRGFGQLANKERFGQPCSITSWRPVP